MHIEYRVSERDYQNAATLANRKRSNLSALEHFWPYIFAVVWILIPFLPNSISGSGGETDDLYFELGVIPVFILLLYGRRLQLRREYRKMANLKLLQQLDLDASGLRLATSLITTRTAWTVYHKYAENENVFILYLDGNQGFVPIIKSFLTALQIDELRALLQANLPGT